MRTRNEWPEAFAWLLDTATSFKHVIVPRIRRIVLDSLPEPEDRGRAEAHTGQSSAIAADPPPSPRPADPQSLAGYEYSAEGDTAEAEVFVTDAEALKAVQALAKWSLWVPLTDAIKAAPRRPGVYLARRGADGPVVYVGMAGERAGSGRAQGIRGRLAVYASGKGLTSGLGEAALDRALADRVWLRKRLRELERGPALRAKEWGRQAVLHADIHVRWAVCTDRESARRLEDQCLRVLQGVDLWNRQR